MQKTNIILVGFMGTGKTTVGKLVAKHLGKSFIDMDNVIEEKTGKTIPAIFDEDGEKHFRDLERKVAMDLSQKRNLVVATGGGIVLNQDNIKDFAAHGVVVCLSARPEIIMQRVSTDCHRPLLEGSDKYNRLLSILDARRDLYAAIPCQVDTTDLTPDEVVDRVESCFAENTHLT